MVIRVLVINIILQQPVLPLVRCRLEQAFLHVPLHTGPSSHPRFQVKWAVINCVISLHQLYLAKSPRPNTQKTGPALGDLYQSYLESQKQLITMWNLVSWHLGEQQGCSQTH